MPATPTKVKHGKYEDHQTETDGDGWVPEVPDADGEPVVRGTHEHPPAMETPQDIPEDAFADFEDQEEIPLPDGVPTNEAGTGHASYHAVRMDHPDLENQVAYSPIAYLVLLTSKYGCEACVDFIPTWDKIVEQYHTKFEMVVADISHPVAAHYIHSTLNTVEHHLPVVRMYYGRDEYIDIEGALAHTELVHQIELLGLEAEDPDTGKYVRPHSERTSSSVSVE
jgi:hypothetical protein